MTILDLEFFVAIILLKKKKKKFHAWKTCFLIKKDSKFHYIPITNGLINGFTVVMTWFKTKKRKLEKLDLPIWHKYKLFCKSYTEKKLDKRQEDIGKISFSNLANM